MDMADAPALATPISIILYPECRPDDAFPAEPSSNACVPDCPDIRRTHRARVMRPVRGWPETPYLVGRMRSRPTRPCGCDHLRTGLVIPRCADQNAWAQSRRLMDMMIQGCSMSLFQASQP